MNLYTSSFSNLCYGFYILLHTQSQLVKKIVLLVFYCVLVSQFSFSQDQGDSTLPKQDTTVVASPAIPIKDTTVRKARVVKKVTDSSVQAITPVTPPAVDSTPAQSVELPDVPAGNRLLAFQEALRHHPYYNFFGTPRSMLMQPRVVADKDVLFYLLAGLVFYFAIIRIFYGKYLSNISTLFFRVTMRQQQLRDQLSQAPLPSLLLNILFVMAGGMFLAFLAQYYKMLPGQSFWLLWAYGAAVVMAVYLGKFIILKMVGWIFNVSNATDTYIFIIFMVNKMVGIFLIPALILMAFPFKPFLSAVIVLTFVMLAAALIYRFLISYKPIRHEIKISRFHFFVYLCAFEIVPLLLIYRVLLNFVERSH